MAATCCDSPVIVSDYGESVSCCTNCGEVVESVFLSSEAPFSEGYPQHSRAGLPLKGIRNDGRALAGQEAEARIYRLKTEMHNYIRQFSIETGCQGLCERVCNLFDQAMASGQFRWGYKAVLVAGSSLVLALREANRWESLHDITYLLQKVQGVPTESITSTNLGRVLGTVKSLLHFEHKFQDAGSLMDSVQSTIISTFDKNATRKPPANCADFLDRGRVDRAASTARSLHNQLSRLPWTHELRVLPFLPTACAIAIISLEADARATMPRSVDFAGWLGTIHGTGKATIMSRAHLLQDVALEWIEQVGWLQKYEAGGKKKTGKRLVVARGLADALAHQEKIWRERVDANVALRLAPPGDVREDAPSPSGDCPAKRKRSDGCAAPRTAKRRALPASVSSAAQFLLDPTAVPIARRGRRTPTTSDARTSTMLPTAAHLLSSSAAVGPAPTRLQLLVATRGGEDRIADDELLGDDEFARLLRSQEEIQKLSALRDEWAAEEAARAERAAARQAIASRARRRKRKGGDDGEEESARIDKDAVAKFFEGGEEGGDDETDGDGWLSDLKALSPESDPGFGTAVGLGVGLGMSDIDGKDDGLDGNKGDDEYELARRELMRMHGGSDAVVVGDWRAASPPGWGGGDDLDF